ncbi:MAG TPA: metal-dependent hydrolase [Candidatus Limnocylindria bacterium]|nr:metal-dependent hydrolase [Candidatus Limnocylindria bacterium]
MASLRITRLGHGGVLYRSPRDKWVWVDRWTGAPTYADAYRTIEQVDVVAPTHGHFDHVGDDAADLVELARAGGQVVCSHEMSLFLGEKGIEAVGMNKGGTFEAAGIGFTMVHAEHSGAVTLTGGGPSSREVGCWGWVIRFEDGTVVYHTGDTDLFSDMALAKDRWSPSIAVLPIGGHYTMGPRDAGRAADLIGAATVIPVHYGTFPILAGTPDELAAATSARVVALEPGDTWEAE